MTAPAGQQERAGAAPARPPPWRDVRVLRVAFQVAFVVGVFLLLRWLLGNLTTNMRASGLPTGWGFLDQPAGFDIRGSDIRPGQPIRDALWVGYVNTMRTAAPGVALATVIGVLIGVGRLSPNWLVRKLTAVYVEAFRNTPVLIILTFMYLGVALRLPGITNAAEALGTVLSSRGVWIPWLRSTQPVGAYLAVLGLGLVAAVVLALWRTRRWDATGRPHHRLLWGGGLFLLVAAAGYLALGGPVELTLPARDGRVVDGGIQLLETYAALVAGLVLYTASHIAEIVRGSILAVPKGQDEAAQAVALSGFQRMRYVVLPQAFRIAVPPLGSQFLNLTKNTSLAFFIGYVELYRVTFTAIGNANPAPQLVATMMLAYLLLSLLISFAVNILNRSLQLKGRT